MSEAGEGKVSESEVNAGTVPVSVTGRPGPGRRDEAEEVEQDDFRVINLNAPPDGNEVRLQAQDCVVSIWLPAGAEICGRVLAVLAKAGFDFAWRGDERQPSVTVEQRGR